MRINASEIMVVSSYKLDLITNQLDYEGKKYIVLEESPEIYKIIVLNDNFVRKDEGKALKRLILKYITDPTIISRISSNDDKSSMKKLINSLYGAQEDNAALVTVIDYMIHLILLGTREYEQKLLKLYHQSIDTTSDIVIVTKNRMLDELFPRRDLNNNKKPTE